jgi:S1-C subfamily serine protease
MREGDVIVSVATTPVTSADDLGRLLTEERIGAPLPMVVIRGAEKVEVVVVPWERR